jgi:hypothetical protein
MAAREFEDHLSMSARTICGVRMLPTDSPNLGIFERSEVVAQVCRYPEDIIVSEECDRSANLFEPLYHLKALVGFVGSEDLDMRETELVADCSNMVDTPFWGDYDYGGRVTSIDGKKATAEVIAVGKSWNDHSNVPIGIAWCTWKWDWLEGP